MSVQLHDIEILECPGQPMGRALLPPLPYIRYCAGTREPDSYQCRERPFKLSIMCWQHLDESDEYATRANGNQLYADTGEAFVHKRLVPPVAPIMPNPPATREGDFDAIWGTQIKTYTSPERYLDDFAFGIFDIPPQRLLLNEYLDQTPAQVEKTEMERTRYLQGDYASSPSSGLNFVAYRALRRTQIRFYTGTDRLGNKRYCAVGAQFEGEDLLIFLGNTGIRDVRDRSARFGSAPLANAYANDVLWETKRRFAATFLQDDMRFEEFCDIVRGFARSVAFAKERMAEMAAETEQLKNNEFERLRRERDASHRMLEQMKAEHARQEAERARLNQMRAEQRAADRARRESWNRQQEHDRARRNAWSDAIRGVDRYEHPYDGSTIEVRAGHGQRAFYNPAEDRVITADSDIDIPFGYEELRRKD